MTPLDRSIACRSSGSCGQLTEREGHHPDLHLEGYHNFRVELWTHSVGGLSENDFVLAAKTDKIVQLEECRTRICHSPYAPRQPIAVRAQSISAAK